MENRTTTYIILGNARSGTSLTAGVVNALGVPISYDKRIYTKKVKMLGELYENALAAKINQVIYGDVYGVDVTQMKGDLHWALPFPRPEELEKNLGEYDEYIDMLLDRYTGVWGFKNPKTSLTLKHWQRRLKNPRYIVVTRNPLQIARSWQRLGVDKVLVAGDPRPTTWQLMYENNYLYNYLFECLQNEPEENIHYVCYEQLLNDPDTVLADLARFIYGRRQPKKEARAKELIAPDKVY